eukprot:15223417-Alexandrium_andersonii.AAC.1
MQRLTSAWHATRRARSPGEVQEAEGGQVGGEGGEEPVGPECTAMAAEQLPANGKRPGVTRLASTQWWPAKKTTKCSSSKT